MGFLFGEKIEMEVNVARFKCIHPSCAGRMENDYSVQTIYEHIAQHLFQDTGERDHFNLRCSCGTKFNFSLMPYATVHLDQNKHELNKHQIICSPITVADVEASKKVLAYQKRFIEFKQYVTEPERCPNLGVFPKKNTNTPLHQILSTMDAFRFAPDQNHDASTNNDNLAIRQEMAHSPRTPIYGRSPSPPARRPGYNPPDQHDTKGSPRSRRSHGSSSGRATPKRYRERRSSEQHYDRRSSERRRDRRSSGQHHEGRSADRHHDRRSPSPNYSHRGRFGRDSDRGISFGRGYSRDGDNQRRFFNDRGGRGRGRGRGWGRGRGSFGNGYDRRFDGSNLDVTRSHNAFNEGNDCPNDKLIAPRKRIREGISPRSSDDDSNKGEPETRRPGNPSVDNRSGNSFGGGGFAGGNGLDKTSPNGGSSKAGFNRRQMKNNNGVGKASRDAISPRSSDDDEAAVV